MTDSSAGKSMATRQGINKKGKHIMLKYLFVQDLVASSTIKVCKFSTVNNLADIFTKYVPSAVLNHLLPLCGVRSSKTSKTSSASYSVNSINFATSSRLTTPRRTTRTPRGSTDRLEGGNNSNNNSNLPTPWIAAREPTTWATASSTAASRELQQTVADRDQANQQIISWIKEFVIWVAIKFNNDFMPKRLLRFIISKLFDFIWKLNVINRLVIISIGFTVYVYIKLPAQHVHHLQQFASECSLSASASATALVFPSACGIPVISMSSAPAINGAQVTEGITIDHNAAPQQPAADGITISAITPSGQHYITAGTSAPSDVGGESTHQWVPAGEFTSPMDPETSGWHQMPYTSHSRD
eukprot:5833332-Amphidinium_carterae.1